MSRPHDSLTVEGARREVAAIKREAALGDDGSAHGIEDSLHQSALRTIARDYPDHPAGILAREALKSVPVDFTRWRE